MKAQKKRENFGERKHNDFLQKSVRFYTLGNGWISKCKKVWFSLQFFSDLSHQIKVNFHVGNKDDVLQILFTIAVLSCLRDLYSRSWTLLKILDSKVACFPTNICVFETSDTVQYSTMLFLKKYRGHSFSVLFFVYYLWLVVYVVVY